MNWIGGEYNRAASGKHRSLQPQQRAHFAKARAAAASTAQPALHVHKRTRSSSSLHASHRDNGSRSGRSVSHVARSYPSVSDTGSTQQELRLLQKRQELLQRSDWLDLRPKRPLQLTFREAAEKDMVGKRRKVTRRRTPVPEQAVKSHVPTYKHLEPPQRQHHSPSTINFRFGSAALTQPSHAQPLVSQMLSGAVAAELDTLSEEPMLLDSEEEVFEGRLGQSDSAPSYHAHSDRQYGAQRSSTPVPSRPTAPMHPGTVSNEQSELTSKSLPWSTSSAVPQTIEYDVHKSKTSITSSEKQRQYGKCWKRIVGVAATSQYCASNVAMKSYVETGSSDTVEPRELLRQRRLSPNARNLPREPSEAGFTTSLQVQPSQPELVLDQHTMAIKCPMKAKTKAAQDPQTTLNASDAIWRQFIIGDSSQDSG